MRRARLLVLIVVLTVAGFARAEDYGSLVDRGEFFLAKGASYMPDAVRALETAAETDPKRAASDARFVSAIAKAYFETSRLSEAYQWILTLERANVIDPKVEALRDHLLNEAGVGRFRLTSKVPASGLTASFEVGSETRLDGAGKKVLEKLNLFLQKPFSVGKDGFTLLVPEGKLTLTCNEPLGGDGIFEKQYEIYAGDEVDQHVVAAYPTRELWKVVPGNRLVKLSWPMVEKVGGYRLTRSIQGKAMQVVYEGQDNAFTDTGAPPGVEADYTLHTYGADGLLWGIAKVAATAKPPVSEIRTSAHLNGDLNIILDWELGDGSLDRLLIRKREHGEEKTIVDQSGEDILRSGEITDGPVVPAPAPQPIEYTIEAVVEGEKERAAATVTVPVPAQAARIDSVREQFTPERVYVEWETFPRDAIAEGYHIYLMREKNGMGELVGSVVDATAREFSYVPKTVEQPTAQWKHTIVPYLGKRFLVDPAPITASDKVPEVDFQRRIRKMRKIPNMVLSWEPYVGASRYVVRLEGKKEFIVRENYVELNGLQANLTDTSGDVKVFALTSDGSLIMLLSANVAYYRYHILEVQRPDDE